MEHTSSSGTIFGLFIFLLVGLVALAMFAFWVWMLVHAIMNKGLTDTEKLIWVLVILFANLIGAIIYCIIGRTKNALTQGPGG